MLWIGPLLLLACSGRRPPVPAPRAVERQLAATKTDTVTPSGPSDGVPAPVHRVRRSIPEATFPPAIGTCHEPAHRFCREGCASLSDFAQTFDCHHVDLQRCGPYRALTVMGSLAGFIALFDDEDRFVAGVRWSDSTDACNGTAMSAYFGPPVHCTAGNEFVPWCADRPPIAR
jgi:hypothetical protein